MSVELVYARPVIEWCVRGCRSEECVICRKRFSDSCLRETCTGRCVPLLIACGHGFHAHCAPDRGVTNCYLCLAPLFGCTHAFFPSYGDVRECPICGTGANFYSFSIKR